MSILAIDFGTKRIGLAISEGFLAQPFGVLQNDKSFFPELKRICSKNNVEKIVVGLPEGQLVGKILRFAKTLGKELRVQVELESEILTTETAKRMLIEAKKSQKFRKKSLDAAAACLILQHHLDSKK